MDTELRCVFCVTQVPKGRIIVGPMNNDVSLWVYNDIGGYPIIESGNQRSLEGDEFCMQLHIVRYQGEGMQLGSSFCFYISALF